MASRSRCAAGLCVLAALFAASAFAETAWVREGASLKLREGAGPKRAVIGAVGPGERVEVLGTLSGWTQVRLADGSQGWLANAYLVSEAPPSSRIADLEAETAELRAALAAAEREATELRAHAAAPRATELGGAPPVRPAPPPPPPAPRGEARWLDYLVGALLLATGMAFGAMIRSLSGRRRTPRLRL
jgi:uncharacterized protein YraI